MTEKQQAMRDALTAIIQARQPRPDDQLPPGDINMPVDPELLQPESKQQPKENKNLKIDDPDNLLKQQQNKQKQPRQPEGPQGPQGEGPQGPEEPRKSDHDVSDDFAQAWNEILARYDNDDITDDQLQKLLGQVQLGLIDKL